jgi:hypothetical protein
VIRTGNFLRRLTLALPALGATLLLGTATAPASAGAVLPPAPATAPSPAAPVAAPQAGPVFAVDPTAAPPTVNVYLQNANSGLCAHDYRASRANGAPVDQVACHFNNGDHTRVWKVIRLDNHNHYLVQNLHSRRCLHIVGASRADGARVNQVTCNRRDLAQVWRVATNPGSRLIMLGNVHSGRCLNVVRSSRAPGARLDQTRCDFTGRHHAQLWLPVRATR